MSTRLPLVSMLVLAGCESGGIHIPAAVAWGLLALICLWLLVTRDVVRGRTSNTEAARDVLAIDFAATVRELDEEKKLRIAAETRASLADARAIAAEQAAESAARTQVATSRLNQPTT